LAKHVFKTPVCHYGFTCLIGKFLKLRLSIHFIWMIAD
jgi:hypothetical protein